MVGVTHPSPRHEPSRFEQERECASLRLEVQYTPPQPRLAQCHHSIAHHSEKQKRFFFLVLTVFGLLEVEMGVVLLDYVIVRARLVQDSVDLFLLPPLQTGKVSTRNRGEHGERWRGRGNIRLGGGGGETGNGGERREGRGIKEGGERGGDGGGRSVVSKRAEREHNDRRVEGIQQSAAKPSVRYAFSVQEVGEGRGGGWGGNHIMHGRSP